MWEGSGDEGDRSARAIAPEDFLVVDLGGVEFLAGPSGAFLVVVGTDRSAVERLSTKAQQVRRLMAGHLQWVPFIHPVVLSDTPHLVPRATTLTGDELRQRMLTGRVCIEPETLEKIGEMVERGILRGSVVEPQSTGR